MHTKWTDEELAIVEEMACLYTRLIRESGKLTRRELQGFARKERSPSGCTRK
jgi:hypothetical protein